MPRTTITDDSLVWHIETYDRGTIPVDGPRGDVTYTRQSCEYRKLMLGVIAEGIEERGGEFVANRMRFSIGPDGQLRRAML